MERRCGIGILGQRWWTLMWEDDPVRRRDGRCQRTGQEADYPSEGSLTGGGLDRGGGNNSFVTISNRY